MNFTGEFETHLTVRLAGPRDVEALRGWAGPRGLKCTHIVLARGRAASQPMLTRTGRGTLSGELAASRELGAQLRDAGFDVCRVKVEAAPWTSGVPQSDAEASAQPPERYFEHHAKLLLEVVADLDGLAALAQRHGAHLSRNALRARDDGRQERFVTQRCHGVGQPAARRRLEALVDELKSNGYEILEVEEEYVVFDSDVYLDAGWIEPEGVSR